MIITLNNLSEATTRQVFDQVKAHLLNQMERCVVVDGLRFVCRYVHDGKYCAAGCLIGSDETARILDAEGVNWTKLVEKGLVPPEHLALIADLQSIHDNCAVTDWADALDELETKLGDYEK